jgi:hypothetical protein
MTMMMKKNASLETSKYKNRPLCNPRALWLITLHQHLSTPHLDPPPHLSTPHLDPPPHESHSHCHLRDPLPHQSHSRFLRDHTLIPSSCSLVVQVTPVVPAGDERLKAPDISKARRMSARDARCPNAKDTFRTLQLPMCAPSRCSCCCRPSVKDKPRTSCSCCARPLARSNRAFAAWNTNQHVTQLKCLSAGSNSHSPYVPHWEQ